MKLYGENWTRRQVESRVGRLLQIGDKCTRDLNCICVLKLGRISNKRSMTHSIKEFGNRPFFLIVINDPIRPNTMRLNKSGRMMNHEVEM